MKYEYSTTWVRGNWDSEEQKAGLVGKQTVQDARYVDMNDLTARIQNACNKLGQAGYEVISVMPAIRGYCDTQQFASGVAGSGHNATNRVAYGFSVTDGAIITAKRAVA